MRISCFGCLIIMIIAIFTFAKRTDGVLISLNIMAMGFVIVPIIPIGINFSSELTFPIEPTVITGTLLMLGQLGGFIMALVAGFICDIGSQGASYCWILFSMLAGIGSICSVFIEEDLRKTNFNSRKVESTTVDRLDEVGIFQNGEYEKSEEEEDYTGYDDY